MKPKAERQREATKRQEARRARTTAEQLDHIEVDPRQITLEVKL